MDVFIYELIDRDVDDHVVLTGRFLVPTDVSSGGITEDEEHPSLDAALQWARSNADTIVVEFEDVRYAVAGAAALAEFPPLGPAELERAAIGRRRWRGEEWLDRTELDEPILWLVNAEVHPGELVRAGAERDAQMHVLDSVETELTDAGFEDVFTSTDGLDDALDEMDEPAAEGEAWHGTIGGVLHYELRATVLARTWRAAVALAVGTVADALSNATGRSAWSHTTEQPLHEAGWGVMATAWPVDAEPPKPPPV